MDFGEWLRRIEQRGEPDAPRTPGRWVPWTCGGCGRAMASAYALIGGRWVCRECGAGVLAILAGR